METVKIEVFLFNELSDSAKEKAREWYRNAGFSSYYDFDSVIEDFRAIGEILGFDFETRALSAMGGDLNYKPEIYFSGFCSQGDGASFKARYKYEPGAAKKIRAHAPKDETLHNIAARLQRLQKPFFYSLTGRIYTNNSRYCHEYTMQCEAYYSIDETRDLSEASAELLEIARDFARWFYKQLEAQNDYMDSNECIDELLEINEYKFLESGKRFDI